jgi:TfoX/Sxy family transcriptional regulator of competence genes
MAYSTTLAARIRARMSDTDGLSEKKMFGGIAFLVHGKMCVGVIGEDLCARVGTADFGVLSEEPGARPMDFTGRPMKGWLFVGSGAVSDDNQLQTWIDRCHRFVTTLR